MKLINNHNKVYKLMSWYALFILFMFLISNIGVYMNVSSFAKKHNANSFKLGLFNNEEYPNVMTSDITGVKEVIYYEKSLVKFYRGGKDIIITDNLYDEYNNLSLLNISFVQSFTLLSTFLLVFSVLCLFASLQTRHFVHAHIIGVLLFFMTVYFDIELVLNVIITPVIIVLVFSYSFFISRTRFCDYNESAFLGIMNGQ